MPEHTPTGATGIKRDVRPLVAVASDGTLTADVHLLRFLFTVYTVNASFVVCTT